MALFGKRKVEEPVSPACACNGACAAAEADITNGLCAKAADGICRLKVLGAGCKTCHTQYENVRAAVEAMRLKADVEYITDMKTVMAYGVMSMPALVVNEKVVSMGKLLKAQEVEDLLHKLGF